MSDDTRRVLKFLLRRMIEVFKDTIRLIETLEAAEKLKK